MPADTDPTPRMVRSASRWTLLAAVVVALAAGLWHGLPGALSAAAGALVVLAFFAFGVLAVNLVVSGVPALSIVGAYVVYATQLMVLLLVIVVARDYVEVDRPAFALGAVVGTMVWQVAHTRAFARSRIPVYAPSVNHRPHDPATDATPPGAPPTRARTAPSPRSRTAPKEEQ